MARMRRKRAAEEPQPLRLEWRSPAELAENPRNWRRHPESQQAALAGALSEVGWAGACLYNERTGRLIDGHLRRKVALDQGAASVPVLVGSWDEASEAKILETLDPLAGMAVPDAAALHLLIQDVQTDCPELRGLIDRMWTDAQAAAVAGAAPGGEPKDAEPQVDRAAELAKQWGTAPGQLWLLGEHRLLCGDCSKPEDVARAVGDWKVNVAFTSPPYASQRKYDEASGFVPIKPDEYVSWWEPVQANVRKHLAADGSFFVNIKPHCEDGERVLYVFDLVLRMKRGWGWRFVDEFCWKRKGVPGGWDFRFKNEFEPIFHFSLSDPKCDKYAVGEYSEKCFDVKDRTKRSDSVFDCNSSNGKEWKEGLALPGNVIDCSGNTESEHNAAFPIGLPSFFIRAFSDEGDVILDPFMGSGTTCVAAENHKRRSVGCEISPKYCAVILQRFKDAFPGVEIRLAE
jgi:DNA modification methylase